MFWDRCHSSGSRTDIGWILLWCSWKQISRKLDFKLMLWMSSVSVSILLYSSNQSNQCLFSLFLVTPAHSQTNTFMISFTCGMSQSLIIAVCTVMGLCTKQTLSLKLSSIRMNVRQLSLQSAESYQVPFLF